MGNASVEWEKATDLPPENLSNRKQRRLFKKRRADIVLTESEVKAIRIGRRKLRREMRARGIYSKKEFELTASSLGLYFDTNRFWGLILWFFHGRGLWALLGAAALLMLGLFLLSLVSQMRGHFTINMTNDLFREGFTLSQTQDFAAPTTRLFAEPAVDVPCISVMDIDEDVHMVDGQYTTDTYFAYTFYIRNEGQSTVDYAWEVAINSESQKLSDATWFMVFEDDQMQMFAKSNADGEQEALPAFDDTSRGYRKRHLADVAKDAEALYEVVRVTETDAYYRLVPETFQSDSCVTSGTMTQVEPMEVHKYTVVIWLEGDDPDCTDDKIGGHVGAEVNFRLLSE